MKPIETENEKCADTKINISSIWHTVAISTRIEYMTHNPVTTTTSNWTLWMFGKSVWCFTGKIYNNYDIDDGDYVRWFNQQNHPTMVIHIKTYNQSYGPIKNHWSLKPHLTSKYDCFTKREKYDLTNLSRKMLQLSWIRKDDYGPTTNHIRNSLRCQPRYGCSSLSLRSAGLTLSETFSLLSPVASI